MKRIILLLLFCVTLLLALDTFNPNRMQFGCQSVEDYKRADNAKGYGPGKVFTDSGCLYLNGIDLVFKESQENYIRVCQKENETICYWTIDTRD